jgi:hypothetical protein
MTYKIQSLVPHHGAPKIEIARRALKEEGYGLLRLEN